MKAVTLLSCLSLSACMGPPAPDVDVCRDAIHRLCIPDVCPSVVPLFSIDSCETTLRANTGCGSDTFTFTTPTREKFIDCRIALLRAGENSEVHPDCDDVAATFEACPEIARFYAGKK